MNRKGIVAILVAAVLLVTAVVVVVSTQPSSTNSKGTIIDAYDRQVNITSTPKKIVSVAPDITEMAYALGAGRDLVGVTDYCDYPQDVESRVQNGTLKSIGGFYTPSAERIVNMTPDLVFVSAGVSSHRALVTQLEALDIKVIGLYDEVNISRVYDNIKLMGKALDKQAKADQLVHDLSSTLSKIDAKVSAQTVKLRVMYVVWLSPLSVVGNGTSLNEMIQLAGGWNAFGNMQGWASPSLETLLMNDPDVILFSGWADPRDAEQLISDLSKDPIWNGTKAFQQGKVYMLKSQAANCFERGGVRMTEAVQLLAEILYPQAFSAPSIPHSIGDEYRDYLTPLNALNTSALTVEVAGSVWEGRG